jgi:hypothetical protein
MKEVLHTWRKPSFRRVLSSSENIFFRFRNVKDVQAQVERFGQGKLRAQVEIRAGLTCHGYQIR